MIEETKNKVMVEISYDDNTKFTFDLILHTEKEYEIMATISQVTRGTLMAANATHATVYNYEGFPIVRYINK